MDPHSNGGAGSWCSDSFDLLLLYSMMPSASKFWRLVSGQEWHSLTRILLVSLCFCSRTWIYFSLMGREKEVGRTGHFSGWPLWWVCTDDQNMINCTPLKSGHLRVVREHILKLTLEKKCHNCCFEFVDILGAFIVTFIFHLEKRKYLSLKIRMTEEACMPRVGFQSEDAVVCVVNVCHTLRSRWLLRSFCEMWCKEHTPVLPSPAVWPLVNSLLCTCSLQL